MTREELRDYVDEQRTLDNIPYHVYSALIDGIDTLEQEPRKGHWIPTYENVKCSVCGSVKDSRDVGRATHYCDFCGAKMESEE